MIAELRSSKLNSIFTWKPGDTILESDGEMTPPRGAMEILQQRNALTAVSDRFAERAYAHNKELGTAEKQRN